MDTTLGWTAFYAPTERVPSGPWQPPALTSGLTVATFLA